MNPLLTPLPASLSAEITSASAVEASGMAAEQADQMCEVKVVPPLKPPTVAEVILCDHRQTLTLFSHFFKAASAAEEAAGSGGADAGSSACAGPAYNAAAGAELLMMKVSAGALALDLHLHDQAEEKVLYPVLAERCGADGALLAQHAKREHAEIAAEVDSILLGLLEEQQLQRLGQQHESQEARQRRQAVVKRMQQLEQAFIAHQLDEELNVLPRIASTLPVAEQRSLAVAFYQSKRSADLLLPGANCNSAPTAPGAHGVASKGAAAGEEGLDAVQSSEQGDAEAMEYSTATPVAEPATSKASGVEAPVPNPFDQAES